MFSQAASQVRQTSNPVSPPRSTFLTVSSSFYVAAPVGTIDDLNSASEERKGEQYSARPVFRYAGLRICPATLLISSLRSASSPTCDPGDRVRQTPYGVARGHVHGIQRVVGFNHRIRLVLLQRLAQELACLGGIHSLDVRLANQVHLLLQLSGVELFLNHVPQRTHRGLCVEFVSPL